MGVDRLHSAHKGSTKAKHTARWHLTSSPRTPRRETGEELCGVD